MLLTSLTSSDEPWPSSKLGSGLDTADDNRKGKGVRAIAVRVVVGDEHLEVREQHRAERLVVRSRRLGGRRHGEQKSGRPSWAAAWRREASAFASGFAAIRPPFFIAGFRRMEVGYAAALAAKGPEPWLGKCPEPWPRLLARRSRKVSRRCTEPLGARGGHPATSGSMLMPAPTEASNAMTEAQLWCHSSPTG